MLWTATCFVFQNVHEIEGVAILEITEVDDDVVTLGDSLGGKNSSIGSEGAIEGDSVLHDVAVIANHMERNRISILIY